MPLVETLENRMLLSAVGSGTISGQLLDIPTFMSPPVAPLVGWEVYLDLSHSGHVSPRDPTTVTDASGDYMFSNLRAANYRVAAVFPPGWVPALGGRGWTRASVRAGQATTSINLVAAPVLANAMASLLGPLRTSFRIGSAGQITLRLANAAESSPVSGRFDITLVASTSSSIVGATLLASTTRAIRVPNNAARNIPLTFRIPHSLPVGTYELFATLLPHGAAAADTISTPASAPITVTTSERNASPDVRSRSR